MNLASQKIDKRVYHDKELGRRMTDFTERVDRLYRDCISLDQKFAAFEQKVLNLERELRQSRRGTQAPQKQV